MAANRHDLTDNLAQRAQTQLGTLGSGNHFLEVCLDEQDQVWVVVHSGSRVDVTGETARARWFISTRS